MTGTGEGVRWLSAVLIVTTIAACGVLVSLWPAAAPVSVPAPLAARGLSLYPAPLTPAAAVAVVASPAPVTPRRLRSTQVSVVPDSVLAATTPAVTPVFDEPAPLRTVAFGEPVADSQPLAVASEVAPALAEAAPEEPVAIIAPVAMPAPVSSHGFVERPVVALTRVATVAGRGIRTGLRATGAALRAAF